MDFHQKLGVWHAPDSNQLSTFGDKELSAYSHMDYTGKVLLDIGACAGAVSQLALKRGANRVISVEPHPVNVASLRANCPNAEIIECAVVSDSYVGDTIRFYEAKTGNLTIGSTVTPLRPGTRNNLEVPVVRFNYLLEKYRPDIIKMDVEGAEFDILTGPLPEYVTEFAAEFHIFMQPDRLWTWWHDICYNWFGPMNWNVTKRPEWANTDRVMRKFHGMNVLTMAWRRKSSRTTSRVPRKS